MTFLGLGNNALSNFELRDKKSVGASKAQPLCSWLWEAGGAGLRALLSPESHLLPGLLSVDLQPLCWPGRDVTSPSAACLSAVEGCVGGSS